MRSWKRMAIVAVVLFSLLASLGMQVALADDGQPPLDAVGQGRARPIVKFTGVIVSRPTGTNVGEWVIGEQTVQAVATTIVDEGKGPAIVGARVSVLAKRVPATQTAEAYLEAILITVLERPTPKPVQIMGVITELDDVHLVVEDQSILYDSSTQITGQLDLGVFVKVRAIETTAGLKALSIEVLPARDRFVEFEGIIEIMGQPTWTISGREVTITPRTVITGNPEVGLTVRVRAVIRANGELYALAIHVKNNEPHQVEWTGVIEHLPPSITALPPVYLGRWVIGGRTVHVNEATQIVGTPAIGLSADVVALEYPKRPMVALTITVASTVTAQ